MGMVVAGAAFALVTMVSVVSVVLSGSGGEIGGKPEPAIVRVDLCATAVQFFGPDRPRPAREAASVTSLIRPAAADFVAATCFTRSRFPFRTAPFDDPVPGGRRDRLFGTHAGLVPSAAVVRAGQYA